MKNKKFSMEDIDKLIDENKSQGSMIIRCLNELKYQMIQINKKDPSDSDNWYTFEIYKSVAELLITFSKQHHSGFSADLTINIFRKLTDGEPLSPLTGEKDEWVKDSLTLNGCINKRCSLVFADDDTGKNAIFLNGYTFIDKDGNAFTSNLSSIKIEKFPYTIPKTIYIRENTIEANAFIAKNGNPF